MSNDPRGMFMSTDLITKIAAYAEAAGVLPAAFYFGQQLDNVSNYHRNTWGLSSPATIFGLSLAILTTFSAYKCKRNVFSREEAILNMANEAPCRREAN